MESLLIDVRTKEEYTAGHCQGSINIPLDTLESEIQKMNLSLHRSITLCCESGGRSTYAVGILEKLGFTQVTNGGSWRNC